MMIATIGLLDDNTIEEVLDGAKQALEEVGMVVEDPEVTRLLESGGAIVDTKKGRVHVKSKVVDECLKSVPQYFSLYNRDLEEVAKLGEEASYFVPGSSALEILDSKTFEAREVTRDDLDKMARLTEQLPTFPVQSTAMVPGDVPKKVSDRVRLYHALRECKKPIVTGTFEDDGFEPMVRMLEAVRGSAEEHRKYPFAVFDCCSVSPFKWPAHTSSVLVKCAKLGIPAELISVPMCGATGPVTLHGALVQIAAENLFGVVIHQFAGAGSPLIWGGCPMAFDMRHGTTSAGAPETALLNLASSQVARHLGMPSHGYLALSDSKALDMQAGSETAMGAMAAAFSGMNMVSGAGMLRYINCQSLEKLVFDAEICEAALRMRKGIDFHADDDICTIFKEGITGTNFLSLQHTRQNYRSELLMPSSLVDRSSDSGSNVDLEERCRTRVVELTSVPTDPLAKDVGVVLDEIMESELRRAVS